jgi:hypothetical protein
MYVMLGWVLLAGLPLTSPTPDEAVTQLPRPSVEAGRVAVWADREDPYRRGDGARVYLDVERPTHVAVFRVDTDGRIRVLFPREPWGETWVRQARELEVTGGRGGRAFVVDDDPGIGYLLAVSSAEPFDFDDLARRDHWDYRAIEGGRISGDPYVALADLAARIAPRGEYDYDISPYYVERHYEYPRFVCYDCHAYAKYDEWDPYRRACARFRVVIYDDPRYYPYRSGRGTNVVVPRPRRPEPRFVFRDANPEREYVTRVTTSGAGEYRRRTATNRTSQDVGGRGAVPAPALSADSPTRRMAPPVRVSPTPPKGLKPAERERRPEPAVRERPAPKVRPSTEPRSTGEPELRRRKP